jgi:hypothetical protein
MIVCAETRWIQLKRMFKSILRHRNERAFEVIDGYSPALSREDHYHHFIGNTDKTTAQFFGSFGATSLFAVSSIGQRLQAPAPAVGQQTRSKRPSC